MPEPSTEPDGIARSEWLQSMERVRERRRAWDATRKAERAAWKRYDDALDYSIACADKAGMLDVDERAAAGGGEG